MTDAECETLCEVIFMVSGMKPEHAERVLWSPDPFIFDRSSMNDLRRAAVATVNIMKKMHKAITGNG